MLPPAISASREDATSAADEEAVVPAKPKRGRPRKVVIDDAGEALEPVS
jgi:hypothetical protein